MFLHEYLFVSGKNAHSQKPHHVNTVDIMCYLIWLLLKCSVLRRDNETMPWAKNLQTDCYAEWRV